MATYDTAAKFDVFATTEPRFTVTAGITRTMALVLPYKLEARNVGVDSTFNREAEEGEVEIPFALLSSLVEGDDSGNYIINYSPKEVAALKAAGLADIATRGNMYPTEHLYENYDLYYKWVDKAETVETDAELTASTIVSALTEAEKVALKAALADI